MLYFAVHDEKIRRALKESHAVSDTQRTLHQLKDDDPFKFAHDIILHLDPRFPNKLSGNYHPQFCNPIDYARGPWDPYDNDTFKI